jgi:hypothetical protein
MVTQIRQQRRSGNSGRNVVRIASLGHGPRGVWALSPQHCGAIRRVAYGLGFGEEWVVVDAVSSEPVSGNFPVKQGKNREFLRIWADSRHEAPYKMLNSGHFSSQFPKKLNRELY